MPTPSKESLDSRLELRLTASEKDLYTRAAEQDGRPLSGWIRHRLTRDASQELGEGAGKAKPRKRP